MEPTPTHDVASQKKVSKRTITALWLLIAPTALWIFIFIAFAISNFILGEFNTGINSGDSVAQSVVILVMNVRIFILGVIAFISWLPGIIIGIVLLATKPDTHQPPQNPPLA
jgi:fatty acid desaturase